MVGEEPDGKDLEAIDQSTTQCLDYVREIIHNGVTTEEMFADIIDETFSISPSGGGPRVELIPGGSEIAVTLENRIEWCKLVEKFKIDEYRSQIHFIRIGVHLILPKASITTLTWNEFERVVCGTSKLDLDMLKKRTIYSGYNATHQVIKWFWEVLSSLDEDQQAQFLTFSWGRARVRF